MNKDFLHSRNFKIIISVIILFIVALLIFQAGIFMGFKRGIFSCEWNQNYNQNFLEGRGIPGSPNGNFFEMNPIRPHGIFGTVITVSDSEIVIKDRDGIEKILKISDDVDIKDGRDSIKITDVKMGDQITVIGAPDSSGDIDAELIRIMPAIAPIGTSTLK
jgi:hypothetical protein